MEQTPVIVAGISVGPMRRWVGKVVARLAGWQAESHIPRHTRKAVVIGAPHTSNWDGVFIVALTWSLGLRLCWLVKQSAYRWPFRRILRFLGAVPVDRRGAKGMVGMVAEQLTQADAVFLALAPEGTREQVTYWRSGFYRIALEAKVPLVLGYLDYGHKRGGLSEPFHPSGDIVADMAHIRAFYEPIQGRHPERMSPVRVRLEDQG